jgi:hypothetical protein
MKTVTITVDESDSSLAAGIEGDALTPEELGPVMAGLLHRTLGDEPQMTDILQIQRAMMGALA